MASTIALPPAPSPSSPFGLTCTARSNPHSSLQHLPRVLHQRRLLPSQPRRAWRASVNINSVSGSSYENNHTSSATAFRYRKSSSLFAPVPTTSALAPSERPVSRRAPRLVQPSHARRARRVVHRRRAHRARVASPRRGSRAPRLNTPRRRARVSARVAHARTRASRVFKSRATTRSRRRARGAVLATPRRRDARVARFEIAAVHRSVSSFLVFASRESSSSHK